MGFSRYGQYVLVLHERRSRLLVVDRLPNKSAAAVLEQMHQRLRSLPEALRRSLTFDNGTEFALHYRLRDLLGLSTFFCDPHAPWQKGGIENVIGRLRRSLPRKADLAVVSQEDLAGLVAVYMPPRANVLPSSPPPRSSHASSTVLHFNRDSTSPPAR